jgi:acyl dehydratase
VSAASSEGVGPRLVTGVEELLALQGEELGTSDWVTLDQERIDAFAAATGDHHWSHVDPARAASSPVGGTIAHGLLTMSLHAGFIYTMVEFQGFRGLFNYGYERVRFPAMVPVGSRVRATAEVTCVERVKGGARASIRFVFESDTSSKPVCVADYVQYFMV